LRLFIIFFALLGIIFADDCYESHKIRLVLHINSSGYTFETKQDWLKDGNTLSQLATPGIRWFARSKDGVLTDAALLDTAGQKSLAQKLNLDISKAKTRSSIQLAIGLPIGLAMMGGGAYYGYHTWDKEVPSTIDMAGSVVLGIAGLGVVIEVISGYIHHHSEPEPNEHTISSSQAIDITDRYNSALKRKCHSFKKDEMPIGK